MGAAAVRGGVKAEAGPRAAIRDHTEQRHHQGEQANGKASQQSQALRKGIVAALQGLPVERILERLLGDGAVAPRTSSGSFVLAILAAAAWGLRAVSRIGP